MIVVSFTVFGLRLVRYLLFPNILFRQHSTYPDSICLSEAFWGSFFTLCVGILAISQGWTQSTNSLNMALQEWGHIERMPPSSSLQEWGHIETMPHSSFILVRQPWTARWIDLLVQTAAVFLSSVQLFLLMFNLISLEISYAQRGDRSQVSLQTIQSQKDGKCVDMDSSLSEQPTAPSANEEVAPKEAPLDSISERRGYHFPLSLPSVMNTVLRRLGLPHEEPPVPEGKVRARWICVSSWSSVIV